MDSPVEQEKSLKPMVQIEEDEIVSFRGVRLGIGEVTVGLKRQLAVRRRAKRTSKLILTRCQMDRCWWTVVMICRTVGRVCNVRAGGVGRADVVGRAGNNLGRVVGLTAYK